MHVFQLNREGLLADKHSVITGMVYGISPRGRKYCPQLACKYTTRKKLHVDGSGCDLLQNDQRLREELFRV